ncbi:MAG: mevalonate kinase [Euryarchaeota archaeon]|nr:mevalonate kinase [Euryarchaeota archaeon]
MITSSAPGSVKLFSEHAVVYNRLGITGAFDKRAYAKVSISEKKVKIHLKDFGVQKELSEKEVEKIYTSIKELMNREATEDILRLAKKDIALPHVFIIGNIFQKFGYTPLKIEIRSEIPRKSGLGSSAAVFVALTYAINKNLKLKLNKEQIVELANEGDKVVHGKPSGVDVNTCFFGGYIKFKQSEGAKPLEIKTQVPLVIADTGVYKDTGTMVAAVGGLYQKDPNGTNSIFDEMEAIAVSGLKALKKGNIRELGELINQAQDCLRKLGVSSPEIEELIKIANNNGAYGAKLTGAGGGGCIIAITEQPQQLTKIFNRYGHNAFQTKLGVKGVNSKIYTR